MANQGLDGKVVIGKNANPGEIKEKEETGTIESIDFINIFRQKIQKDSTIITN